MVGVAAVIWVVAIGQEGIARAQAELAKLGDNLVWVEAGSRNVNGVRTGSHGTTSLTTGDAEAIRREMPLIKSVAENVDGSVQVVFGNQNWNTRYRGVSPEYLDIKRWQISVGSFFTDDQMNQNESVVVLGQSVKKRLFGAANSIGEIIRVQGFPFVVIGVLAEKGQSGSGQDQDDTIMMPWTTSQKKLKGRGFEWLDDILCSAISPAAVNPAVDAVTALMHQRHHIVGENDDFNIRRPDEVLNAEIQTSRTFEILLTSVAAISLLVGGIGIMNVMLASVAQRVPEIGLRLAVGATHGAIHLQFLGEAVMLSLFGGVLGVFFSMAGAVFIEGLIGWRLSTPPEAALIAVVVSAAVGVFFGFFPAWKAARLDPVEAIRSE